ncbi:MAG: AraC family transcriptional regulator [Clostridiales bacterium]|nr:AraC family transcriptional regulator [Clostridiales bacterium]
MPTYHSDFFNSAIVQIGDNITVESHRHYECELLYIINGEYRVISGGVTYELHSGDIFFAFPFVEHAYVNLGINETLIAIFSPTMVNAFADTLLSLQPKEPVINISRFYQYFDKLLLHLNEIFNSKADSRLFESCLTTIVGELISKMELTSAAQPNISIERIIRYCIDNLDDPSLTADSAAHALGFSRTYVSQLISSALGGGFTNLLHSIRIEKAINLLLNTDLSMTDITYECGFSSQRTFNRVFKEMTQTTPTDYTHRRSQKK